jgi:hypothetical protein
VRAALTVRRDTLALALARASYENVDLLNQSNQADGDEKALAEELSQAAERVDDLSAAILYAQRADDKDRLALLQREQDRRSLNAARQPVIGSSIEQTGIVQPRSLAGSFRGSVK